MINRNKIFLTVLFLVPALVSLTGGAYSKQTIDRVVAVVNDDVITLSELREMALSTNPTSTKEIDENAVLQQMIEEKLFDQEAKKLGLTVTEAELDASIENVKQKFNLNDAQMAEVLKKQNMTPESFREQWRHQTLGNKLLESQLKNKIVITEEEIQDYYKQNYAGKSSDAGEVSTNAPTGQVKIAHILIATSTPGAEKKAEEVAGLAKSGKDFGQLAKQYSDDKLSADKGGDLGYFKKGDLIAPLETAVQNTPVGGVTSPVESPAGYHVIKVLERTEPEKAKNKSGSSDTVVIGEGTRKEITDILYKQKAEAQLKTWVDSLKQNAYIEIKL
ncbi:MAG: peptidylprolyl isomerase [Thermodesulfobacteriota bacterium]